MTKTMSTAISCTADVAVKILQRGLQTPVDTLLDFKAYTCSVKYECVGLLQLQLTVTVYSVQWSLS